MPTFDTVPNYQNDETPPLRPVGITDEALEFATKSGLTNSDLHNPYMSDIIGAAFRSSNTVGSALSAELLAAKLYPRKPSQPLTPEAVVERLKVDGLLAVAPAFDGIRTDEQYAAAKSQVEREYKDRRILDAAGWTGTFASIGASILDLPSLIPVGGEAVVGARVAESGMNALLKTGLRAGIAGAEQATGSEIGLQATQETRTAGESATNIGGSFFLGGLLHLSAGAVLGKLKGRELQARLTTDLKDQAAGSPKGQSAGAAVAEAYAAAPKSGVRIGSLGYDVILKNAGLPFKKGAVRRWRVHARRSP